MGPIPRPAALAPRPSRPLARVVLLAAVLVAALGCDFGVTGESGCLRVSQGGYSFPEKRVLSSAFTARLTKTGVDFLTERVKALVLSFFDADASGRAIVPLSSLGVGTLSTSLGPLSGQVRDITLTLDLSRLVVRLIPDTNPARLEIYIEDAEVGLVDGTLAGSVNGGFFSGDVACGLANGPNGRVAKLTMRLLLQLGTNSRGELEVKVLPSSFDIRDFALTFVTDCDKAECLDGLPPGSTSECLECETICPVADFGSDILSSLRSALDSLFDGLLDLLADELANLFLDGFLNGKPLVVEGELDLARMVGGWLSWMSSAEPLGLLARPAGQAFSVSGNGPGLGLDVALDMGLDAAAHPCASSPTGERSFGPGPRPTFEGQVTTVDGQVVGYDLALGLSDAVLNQAIWALWRSGALCIRADSNDLLALTGATVSAQTLDLLLPGVAELAGPDAPVRLSVLPRLDRGPDYVRLGEVVAAGEARAPLITFALSDAIVAVDAQVGEAWLRLVAFEADLSVGLDLTPTVEGEVQVKVVDVAVARLAVLDQELFSGLGLETIAPFVVELALGFLSGQDLAFALPVSGLGASFGVPIEVIVAAMGRAGPEGDWLALYLQLRDPPRAPRRLPAPALEVVAATPGEVVVRLPELAADARAEVRLGFGAWSSPLTGPGPHRVTTPVAWLVGRWPVATRALDREGRAHPAKLVAEAEIKPTLVPLTPVRPWRLPAEPSAEVSPTHRGPGDDGCGGGATPWALAVLVGLLARLPRRSGR